MPRCLNLHCDQGSPNGAARAFGAYWRPVEIVPENKSSLRVPLGSKPGVASVAPFAWIVEQGDLSVCVARVSTFEAIFCASQFQPRVVLLDFHGQPVVAGCAIVLFKEPAPQPAVFVPTSDSSPPMRRWSRADWTDAAVVNTTGFETLRDQRTLCRRSLVQATLRFRRAKFALTGKDSFSEPPFANASHRFCREPERGVVSRRCPSVATYSRPAHGSHVNSTR